MEFGERKRRRKSQSFKVVTDEVWLGDEGVEIKRQITGMMRLLNDKSGRVYQRVGAEGDSLKKEPQEEHLSWTQEPAALPLVSEGHQSNSWNSAGDPGPSPSSSTPIPNGRGYGQYSTRSKVHRVVNNTKNFKVIEANDVGPPVAPGAPCCMCNCKGTLQAILQELHAMRRLMQTQKASPEKQEQGAPPCQPRLGPGCDPRHRPRKRRPIYKIAPLTASSRRATVSPLAPPSPLAAAPRESGRTEGHERKTDSPSSTPISAEASALPAHNNAVPVNETHHPLFGQPRGPQFLESEVRLAEDYDVFISKAQLDSILVNYTRSGSLLFRKLVCAFFDDATLANSLPNGKRKRGLNDNRKGLDQNIVGAIKVFTEKYCTAHRIEKLPGPRDWVQILQDQIKLARRRLKRDAADAEDVFNGPCTSCDYNKTANVVETVEK
ncbi:BEN domain-containing protein 7 [Polymixia lowei]